MKITGELLKTERINLKLSVQDVATSLKLSSKIIAAIEAGNLDALPSKTFVRGFVKSYAQLLKLDSEVVLRQFQEEMGTTSPLPKISPPKPPPNENNIKAKRPSLKQTSQSFSAKNSTLKSSILIGGENKKNILLMVLIAVVLLIVLNVSNKIIDNFNSNPSDGTSVAPITENSALNNTASDKNDTAAATNSADLSVNSGSSVLPNASQTKNDADTATPENGFQISSGKPVEILLEPKKDLEIFYARGDSKKLIPLKLLANQIQILRSEVGIHIKGTDAAALKMSVNGINNEFTGTNKDFKFTF